MKQETTLEEVAEKYANDWEEIHPKLDFEDMTPIAISKIDFIEGAKWQQERSYSEEEVKIMYRSLWIGNNFDFDTSYEMESNLEHDFNLWFEQFKKEIR